MGWLGAEGAQLNRLIWAMAVLLVVAVGISLLVAPVCYAGQPTPCKDTEHPNEPPCNMKTCARHDGRGSNCSHWCSKGKGCCFCAKGQCNTGAPDGGEPESERPQ